MFVLGLPLLLLLIIAGVVLAGTHHGHPGQPLTLARTATPGSSPLEAALRRWQAAQLVTPDQVAAIEQYESSLLPAPVVPVAPVVPEGHRRVPPVAEALGYLGGTLGIVGLTLLVARYWHDLATPGRLALTGGAALLLAIGGFLVHEGGEPAFTRLRWFLWLLSAAAAGLFAGVLARFGFGTTDASTIALTVAAVVCVQNAGFWAGRPRPLQQALTLTAAVVAVGTAVAHWAQGGPTGLAVWVVGAALLATGVRGLLTAPALTAGIGAAATVAGAALTISDWQGPGLVFLVLTAGGLLALATLPTAVASGATRIALTVVGALGMLQAAPSTVGYFADRAGVVTGLVVWVVGAGLLLAAARTRVRTPIVVEVVGGVVVVAGAAVIGVQSVAFATVFGIASAIALIGLGTVPGRVLLSLFGSLGLLVNVPWAISHFFPGEGRVPVLILASGAVIVAVAVWLARMGGRFRRELHR